MNADLSKLISERDALRAKEFASYSARESRPKRTRFVFAINDLNARIEVARKSAKANP